MTLTFEADVNPENEETSVVLEYASEESVLLEGKGRKVSAAASLPAVGEYQAVSELAEGLEPATKYYLRVAGTNATGTSYGPVATFTTLAVPLVEETEPEATEVTRDTALIDHITINPEIEERDEEATYYILYGETDAYGQALAAPVHAGAGYGLTGREVAPVYLYGLAPGKTYHFAIVVHNANETEASRDFQFMTERAPPFTTPLEIGTSSAQFVKENSAIIDGEVNLEGLQTTYEVQYGTSTSYGSSTPPAKTARLTTAQGTMRGLAGLRPGTTYQYRLLGSNASGRTYGPDGTLTTRGGPRNGTFTPFSVPTVPQITIAPFVFSPEEAPKHLTNKQKLAAALRVCRRKHSRGKRVVCDREARRKYGVVRKGV